MTHYCWGMDAQNPMRQAYLQAEKAGQSGEVPVGAVVVDAHTGQIIAQSHNLCEATLDPTAHAEMLTIRAACAARGEKQLQDCDLYVTLEPCAMCAGAISAARIRRLYFGAYDPKSGGVEHGPRVFNHTTTHHKPEVYGGVDEDACAILMKRFFAALRD